MKTRTIKQKVLLPATPEEVYNALMDSKKHEAMVGGKAKIGKNEGDAFSAQGGYMSGKNVKLVPGKKIVQTWRARETGWPKEHYSEITFAFKKVAKGTELTFTQKGVPEELYDSFSDGWEDYYWEPMKAYFAK